MLELFLSKTFRGYAVIAIIACLIDALTTRTLNNEVVIAIINTSVMVFITITFVFLLKRTINSLKEVYYQIARTGISDSLKKSHQKIVNKLILRFHFVVNAIIVTVLSVFRGIGIVKDNFFFTLVFMFALIFRFLILEKIIENIKNNFVRSTHEKNNYPHITNVFEVN